VSQGHRSTRRPRREPFDSPNDFVEHSTVRLIPNDPLPDAVGANDTWSDERSMPAFPAVVRPTRAVSVRDVVPRLRARQPVVLELDRIEDDAQRRRAMDFVAGLAYGLDAAMSGVAHKKHAFLLEPTDRSARRHDVDQPNNGIAAPDGSEPRETSSRDQEHPPNARTRPPALSSSSLCVLCDLRRADETFESPLDMVIRRDGTRIHSPPALVCVHCRSTIRHWRFVIGWCPECERWGRRGVMSSCGIPYGA
jgi:hypothetical protein